MVVLHTIVLEEHSLKTPPASVALLLACLSAQSGSLQGRGRAEVKGQADSYRHSY